MAAAAINTSQSILAFLITMMIGLSAWVLTDAVSANTKIAAIEAKSDAHDVAHDMNEKRLARIENKIDVIIQRACK